MKKVVEFLQANPVQYLATVGRDGKAKCRPFMFCFEKDGKLWFCTNNTKDVYKDMQANPEIEISVSSPEYAWIRLHGKAVFENNMAVKEGAMLNPIVKGQYQTADNPISRCSIWRMHMVLLQISPEILRMSSNRKMLGSKGILTPMIRIASHFMLAILKHLKIAHFSTKNGYFSGVCGSISHALSCKHETHDLLTPLYHHNKP